MYINIPYPTPPHLPGCSGPTITFRCSPFPGYKKVAACPRANSYNIIVIKSSMLVKSLYNH